MLTQTEIETVLNTIFGRSAENLTTVASGQMSQTYAFQVGAEAYIIRFIDSSMSHGYYKDQFAYEQFASPQLPIPRILTIAEHGDHHYALSKKLDGQELSAHLRADFIATIPSILETLHAIHQADVGRWHGYGYIDTDGNGADQSWADFHKQIMREKPLSAFYGKWHSLFDESFLERDFYESIYQKMVELLDFCPDTRYLLHGDFGYDNVLAHNGTVTAVLDWANAKYGDFVSDIAYVTFWMPNDDLLDAAEAYYRAAGMPMEHFAERLLCYKLYLGLDGLRFFAKIGNEEGYRATRERIEHLLRASQL